MTAKNRKPTEVKKLTVKDIKKEFPALFNNEKLKDFWGEATKGKTEFHLFENAGNFYILDSESKIGWESDTHHKTLGWDDNTGSVTLLYRTHVCNASFTYGNNAIINENRKKILFLKQVTIKDFIGVFHTSEALELSGEDSFLDITCDKANNIKIFNSNCSITGYDRTFPDLSLKNSEISKFVVCGKIETVRLNNCVGEKEIFLSGKSFSANNVSLSANDYSVSQLSKLFNLEINILSEHTNIRKLDVVSDHHFLLANLKDGIALIKTPKDGDVHSDKNQLFSFDLSYLKAMERDPTECIDLSKDLSDLPSEEIHILNNLVNGYVLNMIRSKEIQKLHDLNFK